MVLLFALTVSAVTVGFYLVQRSLGEQLDILVREHVTETTRVLHRVLDLRASGARIHADDYTRWDEFVAFVHKPTPTWGRVNLTENIQTFGIDVAWVLDPRFHPVFTANPESSAALAPLPVPLPVLAAALRASPIRHFFATTKAGVLEIWTSSIQPSDDLTRKTPAAGYYIVARRWTPARIDELAGLMDGRIAVTPTTMRPAGSSASSETGEIRITLPFSGIGGFQVAALDLGTTYPMAPRVHTALRMFLVLMMAGVLVLFIGVSLALTGWVGHPLARITESLRTETPALLGDSVQHDDEFGDLARLVRDFFTQRGKLIEAREATEAAALAKQQFLANISHELRTPMHGIISFSRFGIEDAAKGTREDLLDYFQQIATCGATLLSLLDDLLDLAKFDSGRMKLEFGVTALGDLAGEAAHEFATLYRERKVTLDFESDAGLEAVRADRNRLRQVFRNLLSNAGKFTPVGGTVVFRVVKAGAMVRVTVEDSGRGIPQEELESVFDRFSQASNNRSGSGGTGLGLPLCREIVQAHGGRIWAENREPKGTRMIFEVPCSGPPATLEDPLGDANAA
jgi:signal transduction histidine kinase